MALYFQSFLNLPADLALHGNPGFCGTEVELVKLQQMGEPADGIRVIVHTQINHLVIVPAIASMLFYNQKSGRLTAPGIAAGVLRRIQCLEQRVTGSQIILKKNENYAYPEKVNFDRIVYNVIGEDTTRVEALSTGQADFSLNPPFDMLEQLNADPNVNVTMFDTFGVDFVAMNTKKAPFDDINVRRAIASAIDVQTIYDALLVDICGPSTGLPFNASLYASIGDPADWTAYAESYNKYTYDVEQAKAYLAESAYPDGFSCTLAVPESSVLNSEALFIQALLADIGITVEINKMPQNDLYAIQQGSMWDAENDCRDFDMGFFTWYADYPDAAGTLVPNYLSANEAPGGCNVSGYTNEKVDELLLEQATKTTAGERGELCMEALDIIGEEVPVIIIDYPRQGALQNVSLAEVPLNASYMWNLHAIDMARK